MHRTTAPILARLALVAALLLTAGCGTGTSAASADAAADELATAPAALELQRFTSGADGFHTHSYWLDTGREVVVFDAQFTAPLAEQLLAEIEAATDSRVRWVVLTHPNPDKFNGAAVFQRRGAKVVASEATAAAIPGVHAYKRAYFVELAGMFSAESYPAQAVVDLTFSGAHALELEGEVRVELRELGHAGVSSTQTVAWIPDAGALVVGDLVHHGVHAWLEGGIVDGAPRPDLAQWIAALEEVAAGWPQATVLGGRGESAPVAAAVPAQIEYLRALDGIVRGYVGGLADPAVLAGPDAAAHHRALADAAAAAFPGYAHAYLIEYGVYGLAGAVAAAQ